MAKTYKTTTIKPSPFSSQTRQLNAHVSKHQLKGQLYVFTHYDLKTIYEKFHGTCCYCGLELTSGKQRPDTAHFTFRYPLKAGGSVCKENIVLLCYRCKYFRAPKNPVSRPIFGFDAFSDLVVHLVQSVIEGNEEKTRYFQVKLDEALSTYIGTLFYKPLGTPKQLGIDDEEKRPIPMSEIIKNLTEEIKKNLKLGTFTKEYKVERKIRD